MACPSRFLKQELDLQDRVLEIKLIKKALDKKSVEGLQWAYDINPNCEFIWN